MKNKLKKWGYKVWARAGRSGYIYSFIFYGDNTVEDLKEITHYIGESGTVVLRLTNSLPSNTLIFFLTIILLALSY